METERKPSVFDDLTISQLKTLGDLLNGLGLDRDLLDAALADHGMVKMALASMKSYRKSHQQKPEILPDAVFSFDVPTHLGRRLYRKVDVVEGWYPERELRLAPNTERTASLADKVGGRLVRITLESFSGQEVVRRMESQGLGSATLEQLIGFALAHRQIAEHCILMAPGTISTDMEGFAWCFPSLRTQYTNGTAERVLDLDLLTGQEVLFLGIVPQD